MKEHEYLKAVDKINTKGANTTSRKLNTLKNGRQAQRETRDQHGEEAGQDPHE